MSCNEVYISSEKIIGRLTGKYIYKTPCYENSGYWKIEFHYDNTGEDIDVWFEVDYTDIYGEKKKKFFPSFLLEEIFNCNN